MVKSLGTFTTEKVNTFLRSILNYWRKRGLQFLYLISAWNQQAGELAYGPSLGDSFPTLLLHDYPSFDLLGSRQYLSQYLALRNFVQFPDILSSGRVQGKLLRLLHFLLFKIYETVWLKKVFPGGACGKEPACQCRKHTRHELDLWVGKILWRRAWQLTLVSLSGESHGQRSLEGYSPQGHTESDMTEATQQALTG